MKYRNMLRHSAFGLLAALLALTALAGCNGQTSAPSGSASGSSQAAAAGGAGEGTVTLTALVNANNTMTIEPDEMPSFQSFERETGVDVQWEVVRTGWDERKMLVLASGDLPDMFFGNRAITASDVIANTALFTDLAPHLDQMPNVSAMFGDEPSMKRQVLMEDGSIYFLPARMPLRPKTLTGVYINQKWLDTLQLPMPETTDDLVAVLEAFRDKDPNGNGIADEIPLIGSGVGADFNALTSLFGAFGVTHNEFAPELLMVKDGALHFAPTLDGWKQGVQFMHRLFQDKLVDPESFTQDGSQSSAKSFASDPQVVGITSGWVISSTVGEANKDDYVAMPPLAGPNGDRMWSSNPIALATVPCTWVLSSSCKNPDAAMKFVDHMYLPENSVQLYFGSYGVSLEKLEDGKTQVLESGDPDMPFDSWLWTNGFGDMGPYYVSRDFEETLLPNSWVNEKMNLDAVYTPYIQQESDIYPPMLYSQEDSNELSVLQTDINNIVNQKLAAWISGEADVETEWESYLQSLDQVGLPRMMEIYNKYWTQSKASAD